MRIPGFKIGLIASVMLGCVLVFQNCEELQPATSNPSVENASIGPRNSGGEGYGGKTYAEVSSQVCSTKTEFPAVIEVPEVGKAYLVRENCQDLKVPVEVSVQKGTVDKTIVYSQRTFYEVGQFFGDPGFERGPPTAERDPNNTYHLRLPIPGSTLSPDEMSVIVPEAARSGNWGLRLKKAYFSTARHHHFLKAKTRYRISFWARIASASANPSGALELHYGQGIDPSLKPDLRYFESGTSGATRVVPISGQNWKQYSIEFFASAGAPYFSWAISQTNPNNAIIDLDDFSIEEVACGASCTDFQLSTFPWTELDGRFGTPISFPAGRFESTNTALRTNAFFHFVPQRIWFPPADIVSARLSPEAARLGTNGFQFAGYLAQLNLPQTILDRFVGGRKYRISFWMRRIRSYPNTTKEQAPTIEFYSYAKKDSPIFPEYLGGNTIRLHIDETSWKKYHFVLEPSTIPGFTWSFSMHFNPGSDLVHIDEITIEEF